MAESAVIDAGLHQLLRRLADGRWHSGEVLAAELGVSRAAVWKRIGRLREIPGIRLEAGPGKGYRLQQPLELLERDRILEWLSAEARSRLETLHLLPATASTSSYLQARPAPGLHRAIACLAEHQTAGRGRRGRHWVSVFGRNLYLSLAWRFDLALPDLAGLSLAAGVALARVLEETGLKEHRLKWPNDLLVDGKKLAGILVEASGEASGPCTAIIGVGLNLELDAREAAQIGQPWTDLRSHLEAPPGRNRLAGRLLERLLLTCVRYQQQGLEPFLAQWKTWDGFLGQEVAVLQGESETRGVHAGLDARGGLVLEREGRRQVFYAGEVSLRGDSAHG